MWLIACAMVHEIHFTIIVSLHLHMHFDINWSFSLICIVHFIIDLIFQMNSIISINLMIKSPLQYTKVQCKTRIVGVNFYFACGILYRYNCKMQNIIHSLFSTLCMYVAEDIVFARNLAAQWKKDKKCSKIIHNYVLN